MLDQPFEEAEEKEMSFLDHLEILRWHLIRSISAIAIGAIAAFAGRKWVVAVIEGPTKLDFWTYRKLCDLSQYFGNDAFCIDSLHFQLINRKIMGQFTQHLLVSVIVGFVLAFPYLLFEGWRFLKPALRQKERSYLRGVIFSGSILFFMGVFTGYFMLAPISIQFLVNYTFMDQLANTIDISSYISLLAMVTLAAAAIFELPIVVYFLAKIGLVTPGLMRNYRRHALLVILILSAIITPPDITSQILLSIPFFILYETSILIAAAVVKREKEAEKRER
ncbi:MAG: twin-arginine translocase subunit TatC [Bacteroidia bacterium]